MCLWICVFGNVAWLLMLLACGSSVYLEREEERERVSERKTDTERERERERERHGGREKRVERKSWRRRKRDDYEG